MHFPSIRLWASASTTATNLTNLSSVRLYTVGQLQDSSVLTAPLWMPISVCNRFVLAVFAWIILCSLLPFLALTLSVFSPVSLILQIYSGTSSPAVDRLCVGVRPGEVGTLQIMFEGASENLLLCMSLLPSKAKLLNRNKTQAITGHCKVSSSHSKKVKTGEINLNHLFYPTCLKYCHFNM